jgi:hypothetical protein
VSARRDDLIKLLAKVKAGAAPSQVEWRNAFDSLIECRPSEQHYPILRDQARLAFMGSLDAAKSLHEAVLPDWRWRFDDKYGDGSSEEYWYRTAWVSSPHSWRTGQTSRVKFGNDARAWLIAILKALISQDTTQEGKP